MTNRRDYDELYVYTLTQSRKDFILQHVVDADMAQNATEDTKPIAIVFALLGLYLHVEKGVSGLRVQQIHMELGKSKPEWPRIALPADRGTTTPSDVIAAPEGPERNAAIDGWCASVWQAYAPAARQAIAGMLREAGIPEA